MFDKSTSRETRPLAISITLASGEMKDGVVFVKTGQRLLDLLNDERAFIPVQFDDGEVMIIAKTALASLQERPTQNRHKTTQQEGQQEKQRQADDQDPTAKQWEQTTEDILKAEAERARKRRARSSRKFNPYAELEIMPDADIETVRAAYRKRIKEVHPDKIAALNLSEDAAAAALASAQRINQAYKMILDNLDRSSAA